MLKLLTSTQNTSSCQKLTTNTIKAALAGEEIYMQNKILLTHISLVSILWDIGKQCRPLTDAIEQGI